MNARIEQTILEKLKQLSPQRLAEVEDFVEFLAAKDRREQAMERLRALRHRQPPEEITEQEMQDEFAGAFQPSAFIASSAPLRLHLSIDPLVLSQREIASPSKNYAVLCAK